MKILLITFFILYFPFYISDASRFIIPRCNIAITRITTNNILETAIAYPAELEPAKHNEYAYITNVVDALFGPPPVIV